MNIFALLKSKGWSAGPLPALSLAPPTAHTEIPPPRALAKPPGQPKARTFQKVDFSHLRNATGVREVCACLLAEWGVQPPSASLPNPFRHLDTQP